MKPFRGQQDAGSHLIGSPARRGGEHDTTHNAYLATGGRVDSQGTRERNAEYSAFDVLVSPSIAGGGGGGGGGVSSTGHPPTGGVSPPRAPEASHHYSSDALVSSALAAVSMPLAVPPRSGDTAELSSDLVGTRDLQRGLLEQKLHQVQREADAVRAELREASGRVAQLTLRLNEQKVEFSALTHRYGAAVEKLTAAEGGVRRLEEHLVRERAAAGRAREERDGLRAALHEAEQAADRLRRELLEERGRPAVDPREVQRLLEDRTRYIPAAEMQQQRAEAHSAQRALVSRVDKALDTLLFAHEEDETAVFVARSAVLSAATDLEAKITATEAILAALYDQMAIFNEGSERDMAEMITALIAENKELWQHLSKLKSEYDAVTTQLTSLRRKGEYVPHDQYSYTQKQLAITTEKLNQAQKAVEAQIEMAKEHEEQMKVVMNSNESLQERTRLLVEQLSKAQQNVEQISQELEESKTSAKEATRRVEELQTLVENERRRMDNTVQQLKENHSSVEQEYENRIRHLQEERNVALESSDRARHDLSELQQQVESLERELESRTRYFENYKQQAEEHQKQINRSVHEEMTSARELLEHELGLIRRELGDQRTATREAERERDDERAERQAAQAVVSGLEAELLQQRRENEEQQRQLGEVTERLQKLEVEAGQLREGRVEAGEEVFQLQRDVKRFQERNHELEQELQEEREKHLQELTQMKKDMRELDRNRTAVQEELQRLRIRFVEVEQQKERIPRERIDAEKETLMRENVRLHEQYQEVQQENVTLRENLQQLRAKTFSCEQLSQQLDDLQERLRQLPALRQAAEDARRDAIRSAEETEALRQERDAMAAKLDFFLEESKQAAKKDEEWGRVFRDAAEQARRLGGQVSMAKQQQQKQQYSTPVSFVSHPGGYSEQYSNYQRALGASGGVGGNSNGGIDTSPHPSAPTLHRPWR
ncbi:uncharacterized protein TM35_000034820 [Trypanosoma theileri]|uniref:Uncharacterized protein n=1 Tax=Trypanosoma theileri TaxID=67003 RepID=A0A1X0P823_9TRYP|nr:uncharacterized protein TM35_000034820 [Trypanosoma theileri]ORC92729.1 hypothetical protein TM35_000034820 [Trypanosoma theileri]